MYVSPDNALYIYVRQDLKGLILKSDIVQFNDPLETLQVISEIIFPANHFTSTKTRFKPNKTATKLQN